MTWRPSAAVANGCWGCSTWSSATGGRAAISRRAFSAPRSRATPSCHEPSHPKATATTTTAPSRASHRGCSAVRSTVRRYAKCRGDPSAVGRTVVHRAPLALLRPRHARPHRPRALPALGRPPAEGHARGRHRLGRAVDGRPGPRAGRRRPGHRPRRRRPRRPRPAAVGRRGGRPRRRPGAVGADAAPHGREQLAAGQLPHRPAARPPHRGRRRGAPPHHPHRRGRVHGHQRRHAARGRLRHHRPPVGCGRQLRRRRSGAAAHVGAARAARAGRRPAAHGRPRPARAAAAAPAGGPARGVRPAHHARRRHRRRAAGAARHRRRADVRRPLPPPLAGRPRLRRAGRGGAGGPRCGAGAAAGHLRRARHLAGRAARGERHDLGRRPGDVLRALGVPRHAAAHGHRGGREDDPRVDRRAQDHRGAARQPAGRRPHERRPRRARRRPAARPAVGRDA